MYFVNMIWGDISFMSVEAVKNVNDMKSIKALVSRRMLLLLYINHRENNAIFRRKRKHSYLFGCFSIDVLLQAVLVFLVICIVNMDLKSMKMAVKYVSVKHVVSILVYL